VYTEQGRVGIGYPSFSSTGSCSLPFCCVFGLLLAAVAAAAHSVVCSFHQVVEVNQRPAHGLSVWPQEFGFVSHSLCEGFPSIFFCSFQHLGQSAWPQDFDFVPGRSITYDIHMKNTKRTVMHDIVHVH